MTGDNKNDKKNDKRLTGSKKNSTVPKKEKHLIGLFSRISDILISARSAVVRNVNTTMVITYWHIGREIVRELQHGVNRASYGEELIEQLSRKLTTRFGRGFSTTNLRYFRTFYLTYADRKPEIRHLESGVLKDLECAVKTIHSDRGFSPELGWTHYRTLMQVENSSERLFYEIEAEKENSVLNRSKQLFASKYMLYLPSEKELSIELKREQRLISEQIARAAPGKRKSGKASQKAAKNKESRT
jgi:hypothetical protein